MGGGNIKLGTVKVRIGPGLQVNSKKILKHDNLNVFKISDIGIIYVKDKSVI